MVPYGSTVGVRLQRESGLKSQKLFSAAATEFEAARKVDAADLQKQQAQGETASGGHGHNQQRA